MTSNEQLTYECIDTFNIHERCGYSMCLTKDGKQLYIGYEDSCVTLYDIENKKIIKSIKVDKNTIINSIDITPDNKYIIISSICGYIKLIDINTYCVNNKKKDILLYSITPNNKYIIYVYKNNTIGLYDYKTNKCMKTFTIDNNLLSASQDNRTYDIDNNIPSCDIGYNLLTMMTSNNKYFIIISSIYIYVYDIESETKYPKRIYTYMFADISNVSFINEKEFITGSEDCAIILWDIDEDIHTRLYKPISDYGYFSLYDKDNILINRVDYGMSLLNIKTGNEYNIIKDDENKHEEIIASYVLNDNKDIYTSSNDNTIKLWKIKK